MLHSAEIGKDRVPPSGRLGESLRGDRRTEGQRVEVGRLSSLVSLGNKVYCPGHLDALRFSGAVEGGSGLPPQTGLFRDPNPVRLHGAP